MDAQIKIKDQLFRLVLFHDKWYINEKINSVVNVPDTILTCHIPNSKNEYYSIRDIIGCSYSNLDNSVYNVLLDEYINLVAGQLFEQAQSSYDRMKKELFGITK
jgi:hypothetical protein